jgi:hypothetical protein
MLCKYVFATAAKGDGFFVSPSAVVNNPIWIELNAHYPSLARDSFRHSLAGAALLAGQSS